MEPGKVYVILGKSNTGKDWQYALTFGHGRDVTVTLPPGEGKDVDPKYMKTRHSQYETRFTHVYNNSKSLEHNIGRMFYNSQDRRSRPKEFESDDAATEFLAKTPWPQTL